MNGYKPTPFNILAAIIVCLTIYGILYPGLKGLGYLSLIFLGPVVFVLLGLDYLGQKASSTYWRVFLMEMAILGLLTWAVYGFS